MLRHILLLFSLLSLPLAAQTLLDTVAVEVCDCMTSAPQIVFPRIQAMNCVNVVASAHSRRIESELQLIATEAEDRLHLGTLLIDRLTDGCPILQGLAPAVKEVKLYYNDISLAERAPAAAAAKNPPADPLETTNREGQELYQTEGTFVRFTREKELVLQLNSGRMLTFLTQPRQLRRVTLRRGQAVRVIFRYQWRGGEAEVRKLLLSVE